MNTITSPANVVKRFDTPSLKQPKVVYFKHDQLVWRPALEMERYEYKKKVVQTLHVKLPNDGFLYKKNEEFDSVITRLPWSLVHRFFI